MNIGWYLAAGMPVGFALGIAILVFSPRLDNWLAYYMPRFLRIALMLLLTGVITLGCWFGVRLIQRYVPGTAAQWYWGIWIGILYSMLLRGKLHRCK